LIIYSAVLEARQHLANAVHHSGKAQALLNDPRLLLAIAELEAVLASIAPPPKAFDDTEDV
jgi:hypothetical protein